ncbi:hypothetical protein IFM47457_00257 [Aspergillus lentulus]|nr:hypothetical protein IFM47457_00257 [Aspergillus lentulus]
MTNAYIRSGKAINPGRAKPYQEVRQTSTLAESSGHKKRRRGSFWPAFSQLNLSVDTWLNLFEASSDLATN